MREISETWGVHTRERCASGVFILEAGVFQEHIHIRDVCLCVCVCVCVCVSPKRIFPRALWAGVRREGRAGAADRCVSVRTIAPCVSVDRQLLDPGFRDKSRHVIEGLERVFCCTFPSVAN